MSDHINRGGGHGKYGRLLKNTAVLTVGTFVSKLLVFLLLPLYTSCLSPAEYGTADLITNLANFLIPIFCCGVSEGVLRFSLREKTEDGSPRYDPKAVFSTSAVITLIGSVLLFLLLPVFSFVPSFKGYGVLVVLYVTASNLHSIAAEYVRAAEKTTLYAFQGVLNTALVILLNITFLLGFDFGIYGYVLAVILADFLTTVFLVFYARLYRDFSIGRIDCTVTRVILRFSIPLIPGTILWWIISVSDRYLLTWLSGAEANGLYVAAAKIPTLLTLMTTVFMTAWKTSAVTEGSGNTDEARREKAEFYSKVYRGFVAILFSIGAGITLFSKLFARILFSEGFFEAWQFIPILTVATVFYSLSRFLGSVYFVSEKSLRSSLTAAAAAAVNIALNLLLIPYYGALGAATATVVAYLVEFVVRDVDAKREIRFSSCRLRVLILSILLLAETAVVTFSVPYAIPIAALLTVLSVFVSLRPLLELARGIPALLKRRSQSKAHKTKNSTCKIYLYMV